MQKYLAVLFCLVALALCGCAGMRGPAPAREALARLSADEGGPAAVRGVGKFQLTREGVTLSGRMAFAAKSPESFRAELLSPFGLPLVSLAANGDRLYYYSRPDRDFTEAPSGAVVMKRALGILISPEALVSLLCGRTPIVSASRVSISHDPGAGGEILTLSDAWGAVREKIWLSPDLSQALRAEVFSPFGKKEYTLWLTGQKNGPATILLKGPDETSLRIIPDRLMTGQEIPETTFVLERPAEP